MKKLIGSDLGAYVFNPTLQTIALSGLPDITLANMLVVTNVTAGAMIYNFADPLLGGSMAGTVLSLDYDTTAMSAGDILQIWVDVPGEQDTISEDYPLEEQFTLDTNMQRVLGSAPLTDGEGVKVSSSLKTKTAHAILIGGNSEVRIDCTGMTTVAIQLTGVWVGTCSFEGSVNGADFYWLNTANLNGSPPNSTNMLVVTSTANAIVRANCAGLKYVRCRFSAYTSGAMTVDMQASAAIGGPGSPTQTFDAALNASLSSVALYTPNQAELAQQIVAPAVSPTQPTSYADNKYARYPQTYRRLRVQAAGDQSLPFAQEMGTNRQLMSYPELYSKMEELLMQQTLTNVLLAKAFNLPLPTGMGNFQP